MTPTCPRCERPVAADAKVCRHCRHIIDRDGWRHDAGGLGADARGGGRPLVDPPVGPIPLTGSGLAGAGGVGGALNGALRLVTAGLLVRRRPRRRRTS